MRNIKRKGAQGSLEYIIIIGGILIIAAAVYFMLKGFSTTTKGDTVGNIVRIGTTQQTELLNMERVSKGTSTPEWGNSTLQNQFNITLMKTDSSGNITFGINATNLTAGGVDNTTLVVGYHASWHALTRTVNGDWYEYTTPAVALGDNITIYLYYDNDTSYTALESVLLNVSNASDTHGTAHSRDEYSEPAIAINDASAFSLGDIISFEVDVDANTGFTISQARFRINTSSWTSEWVDVDGMAYALNIGTQWIAVEGLIDGYGDEEHEDITINIRDLETTGNYTLTVDVMDGTWLTNSSSNTVNVTESGGP